MEGDSTSRRDRVTAVIQEIAGSSNLSDEKVLEYLVLLSGRLGDWACVEPAVEGIKNLYANHLVPDGSRRWPEEESSILSKERVDLSLFLGFLTPENVPDCRNTLTERVLTKLLINVHAPSFGVKVRGHVLDLFGIWITKFALIEIPHFLDVLVRGLSIEGEDERDPSCLSSLFLCIRSLFEQSIISIDDSIDSPLPSACIDDLFGCLSSYFPIQLVARSSTVDDESKQELVRLRSLLGECFVCFKVRSIEFLLPQLDDPETAEDAFAYLSAMARADPESLVSFLVSELEMSNRPLTKGLWRQVLGMLSERNDHLIRGVINRFIRGRENVVGLLSATAGANGRIFSIVVSELLGLCPDEVRRDDDVLEILSEVVGIVLEEGVDMSGWFLGESEADKLVEIFAFSKFQMHALQAHVVEFVMEGNGLEEFIRLWGGNPPVIVAMFKYHLKFLTSRLNIGKFISSLDGSEVVPMVLVELFNQGWDGLAEVVAGDEYACSEWIESVDGFGALYYSHWIKPGRIDFASLPNACKRRIVAELNTGSVELVREIIVSGDDLSCIVGVDGSVLDQACEGLNESDMERLLQVVEHVENVEDACWLGSRFAVCCWKQGFEILPQRDVVWAECVRRIYSWGGENIAEKLVKLIFENRSDTRFEQLFGIGGDACSLVPYVLPLLDPMAEPALVSRALLSSPDSFSFYPLSTRKKFLNYPLPDVPHLQVVMRVLLTGGEGIDWGVLVETVVGYLDNENVLVRFATAQLIGLVPETAPEGRLRKLKHGIVTLLRKRIDIEPKQVVRKQLAVSITNWLG